MSYDYLPSGESCARQLIPDRRTENRQTLVLRLGAIDDGVRTTFCLVRNVSAQGVQVRLPAPQLLEPRVTLRLGDGDPIPAHVVWNHGDLVGLEFLEKLPLQILLRMGENTDQSRRRAGPRVAADSSGLLQTGGRTLSARLRNISPTGAHLELAEPTTVQGLATLQLPSLPPLRCQVCWVAAAEAGLRFITPLCIRTVAAWLSDRATQ